LIDTTYALPTGTIWCLQPEPGCLPQNQLSNLQTAFDLAQPGDMIILHAGVTYFGSFTLPVKTQTTPPQWIYVQSSNYSSLPPPGSRVHPSDVVSMARISDNTGNVAISVALGANHWRFVGIELTTEWIDTTQQYWAIVDIPCYVPPPPFGNSCDNASKQAHHIYFDRTYIHGTFTGSIRSGIAAQGASIAVIDSYISDIHQVNNESYAFWSFNGAGPFKIVNNELEAAAVNVFFGGGGSNPTIPSLVPSDIEIRGNHFSKPLSWRQGDPSYGGIPWAIKNHLEFKSAQHIVIEGNVFEYDWPGFEGQDGFSIQLTPRNESGSCTWCVVQDITFTHNIVRHSSAGINMLGTDYNAPSGQLQRVLVQNDLFDDIGPYSSHWTKGLYFQVTNRGANFVIDHNTAINTSNPTAGEPIYGQTHAPNTTPVPANGFFFTNNIVYGAPGVCGDVVQPPCGLTALNTYFPGSVFSNNVLVARTPSNYPPGNYFPATWADVGFVNYSGGDYHLAASSPYKNVATDGTDPGAGIDRVNSMTANAVLGAARPQWQSVLWTNINHDETATGSGTIQGTANSQGCPTCQNNPRAVSLQQIGSGDWSLQFTAPDINHEYVVSIGHVSDGWAGGWGLHIYVDTNTQIAYFEVREGTWTQKTTPAAFNAGDYFQIAIANNSVQYLRNGTSFYTSGTSPNGQYPMQAFVSLWSANAVVRNALISTGAQ